MATTTASMSRPRSPALLAIGVLAAFLGALVAPPAAFSIDEAIYIDMANAMSSRGAFDVTPQGTPETAPLLPKSDGLVQVVDGRAIPQYPGAYGMAAAPFFLAFGVSGLVLLNALSAIAALWCTHRIALRAGLDDWSARAGVFMLGAASIFAGYIFAVWPHMLSLALVTAGAYATLCAGDVRKRESWMAAALAGLCFGLGASIRVDVILGAIAAFFWLRVFARPSDRISALALIIGLAPGLLLASMINQAKFGVFHPFSYGETTGGATTSVYSMIIVAAALLAIGAFTVDVSHRRVQLMLGRARAVGAVAYVIAATVGALFLWAVAPRIFEGLYLLLVDIQAYAGPAIPGLEKNAYGYWDFWGVPKKALLQSMAYLPLLILPVAAFAGGRRVSSTSFLMLFASAPIAFFALTAWHGGMSYNMRYYLPAAPFLAILCAMGLAELRPVFQKHEKLFLRGAIGGVFLAVALYASAPAYGEAFERPLQLYPQLLIAFLLGLAVTAAAAGWKVHSAKLAAAALSAAALGNAAMLSLSDTTGYWATRAAHVPYDRAYAAMIPNNALIATAADEYLVSASLKGAAISRAAPEKVDALNVLIAAYVDDGRCVLAHTPSVASLLGESRFAPLSMPQSASREDLALFVLKESAERCRP